MRSQTEPGALRWACLPFLALVPVGIITGENQLSRGIEKAPGSGDVRHVGPLIGSRGTAIAYPDLGDRFKLCNERCRGGSSGQHVIGPSLRYMCNALGLRRFGMDNNVCRCDSGYGRLAQEGKPQPQIGSEGAAVRAT